ncbi:hypothetical protein TELCIR_09146 [Teladorsagia circumcincta]|uniref:Uncharacterized protein n=1 Tax=Teladorsagia circumcincta TaxID=45464 RepID=A0A2G9UFK0_TELCI|nr:hypothetical protein TELCIR_09146 [Teladorsagia circumcincta]
MAFWFIVNTNATHEVVRRFVEGLVFGANDPSSILRKTVFSIGRPFWFWYPTKK